MTTIHHDQSPRDKAAMRTMREMLALQPVMELGPEGRSVFDDLMCKTPAAEGVDYVPAVVGGVPGWWCRPIAAREDAVILYLHGGAYMMGSASAYRNFVGQIAARSGSTAFVADYALAPERPFPAAFDDALAAYQGLVAGGHARIVIAGDSAGGGLALALLAALIAQRRPATRPLAAITMSPWIDLALGGDSIETRAKADPLLTREALAQAASSYLGAHSPHDPRASALAAATAGSPPVLIHVGSDEILLDDAVRYADAVERASGEVELHVWSGMAHVFPASVSVLDAAEKALDLIATFARAMADQPTLEET